MESINDLNTYEHICFVYTVYTVYTVYGVYVNTWCTSAYIYIYLSFMVYIIYINILYIYKDLP